MANYEGENDTDGEEDRAREEAPDGRRASCRGAGASHCVDQGRE